MALDTGGSTDRLVTGIGSRLVSIAERNTGTMMSRTLTGTTGRVALLFLLLTIIVSLPSLNRSMMVYGSVVVVARVEKLFFFTGGFIPKILMLL